MKDISLLDMSDELNISTFNVSRLFKKQLGINFKDYLNRHRINEAKSMLNGGKNIKIAKISAAVGYINVETFNRVFKRYEGMSPGEYMRGDYSPQ
jgi:YesN/AraC family two-component response regulator